MASEPIDVPPGSEARHLTLRVSCPYCDLPLRWENGVRRGLNGVATDALALLKCDSHGRFEIAVRMTRSSITREKRPSGAEQRRRARERHLIDN